MPGEGGSDSSKEKLPNQLAVVGLGYVGLPLAVAFARHVLTLGFDVDPRRIEELRQGYDRNREVPSEALRSPNLRFTNEPAALREADFIAVAVPTPVDEAKRPDLSHLKEASRLVGQNLRRGATVVYESTVYPGCTEEICVPILERESGLKAGSDFRVGYSPERVNPGDREHTLEKVVKVVAGQDAETTELLARVYGLVVKAGIHRAPNIKTAEAAKVIENIQRDLNIALMNELAMLFHRLGLSTADVLEAAGTKWNFLAFEPGLVGGHCIPVDPYYLTHKAQEVGYHPEVILAGRRINDSMGRYVAQETIKLLVRAGKTVKDAKVLVLGVAFKENIPDVRNTRVLDLVRELEEYGCQVFVHDPVVDVGDLERLGVRFLAEDPLENGDGGYHAVILAVPHRVFQQKGLGAYLSLFRGTNPGVLVDVKGLYRGEARVANPHPLAYWSL
ncbi:MAG: nucleotide sugar dehydrogenase [Firmicutes bacterium]|nr:nucleotide sugar dehydrogenase [Bacillota bacterium]